MWWDSQKCALCRHTVPNLTKFLWRDKKCMDFLKGLLYNVSCMQQIYHGKGLTIFMKNILKCAGAVTIAAALACASAGCSGDTKWSFKSDHLSLASGIWISYTFDGVNAAVSKVQETDEKATLATIDFNTQKIDGKLAKDWAYAEAKKNVIRYLTVDKLAADLGAAVSDETFDASKYYYTYFYQNYYSEMFEKLGVSEESYCKANLMPQLLENEVFTKIYGKGGSKEVSDADLQAFFVDNYVSYYYVTCDLTTTGENDETVDIDAATKEKYGDNFRKYANMLNNDGKTTAEVSTQYKTDFELAEDATVPETTETVYKDDMSDSDLNKAILALEEGKATTQEISGKLYLIYRYKIQDKVAKIKAADDDTEEGETEIISRENILQKMKSDEFQKYLTEEEKKLSYTRNDACVHKYDVLRTVSILNSLNNA